MRDIVRRVAVAVAVVVAGRPAASVAQIVRGSVVDAGAGQPARGALVTLVDTAGARLSPTLVGETGAYLVAAPAPGAYRVRVDLIGYETWLSPLQPIGTRDTVTLDVRLPLKRVELDVVTVEDQTRCEAQPQQVPQMLATWEEIRRALTISELSTRRGLVPLDLEVVEERMRPRQRAAQASSGRVVVSRTRIRATGSRPWSVRSPRELATHGFVNATGPWYEFIGPDAPILLSSDFVATHCFRSVRKRDLLGRTSAIGLSFEPVPRRNVPDVKGTIWLDARTSELRTVDFSFVNLTVKMAVNGPATGSLEFARQPSGAWYVQKWEMEQERGGRSRGVATPVNAKAKRKAPATLLGVVVDSTTQEPLVGAIVRVPGVDSVVTDSLGRFAATVGDMTEDVLQFVVSVDHPRLAALGLASAEQSVRLSAGQSVTLAAAVPSVTSIMRALCPGPNGDAQTGGLLVGRIEGNGSDDLPDSARVIAQWPSDERLGEGTAARTEERSIHIDADGRFRACPIPVGRAIRVAVEIAGVRGPTTEVTLPSSALAEIELPVKP